MPRPARAHPSDARPVTLDPVVIGELQAILGTAVIRTAALGGGCVSPAFRVDMADGRRIFVKTTPAGAATDLTERESAGLRHLAATGLVRVPQVLAAGVGWLGLEWLEPSSDPGPHDWALLGTQLARLHGHVGDRYGWENDNYIGRLPQHNGQLESWPAFWAERRLRPQIEAAGRQLTQATRTDLDRLLQELDGRLDGAQQEGPSLLHGDLWSGNVHMTRDGPALIDPAIYCGHREVDLAMAALFGGFPPSFHEAYAAEWPLLPGAAARRPIYQLYYLLVHVNLFGASYLEGTERALRAALA
jgi:protein-ribulosamine 3-kinase